MIQLSVAYFDLICEYFYEDYMEKGGYYDGNEQNSSTSTAFNKKI